MAEIEDSMDEARKRKGTVEAQAINLENIQVMLEGFDKTFDLMDDEEQKTLISFLIREIQIYPKDEPGKLLKSIEFKFPIFRDGRYFRQFLWDKDVTHKAKYSVNFQSNGSVVC